MEKTMTLREHFELETGQDGVFASVRHWERMVAWARTRDEKDGVSMGDMVSAIGESWGAEDCALCRLYYDPEEHRCEKGCPLVGVGQGCLEWFSAYRAVERADTWGQWIGFAEEMVEVLRGILEGGRDE